ncbi:MAG: hypothetical protein O9302_01730 [Cyclobacteriaceae bacterium]|jgi:hypothetical protein|nr:hypothetical protein [Flammeovirgaceae bacterium]MCZ8020789.1 hypothetical protein [Cytophagales bacterium]MCZ8326752.1 hypothetical protein [Cyclobacteriaceae bacterium]
MARLHEVGKENLLRALAAYEIAIVKDDGNHVYTEAEYCVEIESDSLYRLSQDGYVIAPYDNLDELCSMIKMG